MGLKMVLERRWWWVVTGISMTIGYCVYGVIYTYGILFGEIQAEFHSSTVVTGWVQSLCMFCSKVFSISGQMLVLRFGYFYVIISAVFMCAFCLLMSSFVPSVVYLYLTYGLGVGITAAISTKPPIQMILEWVPIQYRMRATVISTAGGTLGVLTLSPVIGTLLAHVGWRWTFRICSGFVFILGLVVAPFIRITQEKTRENTATKQFEDKEKEADSELPQCQVLCFPETWIFAFMLVIVSCAHGFTMINLVDFTTKGGFTLEQGTLVLSAIGGAEVVGKLLLATFMDKLPFPKILIWPYACIVSAVTCIALPYVKSFGVMVILSIVLGLMKGIFNSTAFGMAAELFGPQYHASLASLGTAPCGVGFLLAALVGGFSYDLTGSYDSALYACSGMFFVGGVLSLCTLIWQKMCAVERFQCTADTRKTRQDERKDCYTKLKIIEDKLASQTTTQT